MKNKVIIDRIEGKIAVLELDADNYIDVPIKYLPAGVKEGQALILSIEEYHS